MLKKICVVLVLLSLMPLAFAQLSSIKVEREIDGKVAAGENVDITLNLKLRGTEVDSIIITEDLPEGWQLVEASPEAYDFGEGKFKWILYSEPVEDTAIYYTLKAPAGFSQPVRIEGKWITLDDIGEIEGEVFLEPKAEEAGAGEEEGSGQVADYTMLIAGGAVVVVIIVAAALMMRKKKPVAGKKGAKRK